jgi:predicted DNA-binding protein (MmcQ/YjbR family)
MIIPSRENAILKKLRAECAKLPDVTETITWGHPIFRVGGATGKMFCGFGDHKDVWSIGINVGKPVQREMLREDPKRFFPTPYSAHLGWVSMRLDGRVPWAVLRRLLRTAHANTTGKMQPPRRRGAEKTSKDRI